MAIANVGFVSGSALVGALAAAFASAQVLFAVAVVLVAAGLLLRVDVAAHVARVAALDPAVAGPAIAAVTEPQAAV